MAPKTIECLFPHHAATFPLISHPATPTASLSYPLPPRLSFFAPPFVPEGQNSRISSGQLVLFRRSNVTAVCNCIFVTRNPQRFLKRGPTEFTIALDKVYFASVYASACALVAAHFACTSVRSTDFQMRSPPLHCPSIFLPLSRDHMHARNRAFARVPRFNNSLC